MQKPATSLTKRQKQSRVYGCLISIGVFLLIILILHSIKIIPEAEYVNQAAGFKLKHPSYWTVMERPEGGAVVAFVSPRTSDIDGFSENFNITVQPLPQANMSLQKFSQMIIQQVTGTFKSSAKVVSSGPMRIGGLPGYKFLVQAQGAIDGKEVEDPMRYQFMWTIRGEYAYILTYAGMSSEFDKYKDEVKLILKTLEFTSP